MTRWEEFELYSQVKLPRQTPWADWEEWEHVRACLFSTEAEAQEEAIRWIKVWANRGNLPTAVESTRSFVELYGSLHASLSDNARRHMIAMALTRFANGIIDQVQRGQFAQSVGCSLRFYCLLHYHM